MADWLRRWSGRRTLEKIWLPLLRAKLGEGYQRTSAAFIWATIARMYAARRTGLKKEMFGYVPGGYARILERMGQLLAADGVEVRCCQAAEDVAARLRQGPRAFCRIGGAGFRPRGPDHAGAGRRPGVPRPLGRRKGAAPGGRVPRRPLPIAALEAAAGRLLRDEHHRALGPLHGRDRNDGPGGSSHFGGRSLVYLPKYLPAGDPGFETPDDEIEEISLAALERMYPAFRRDDVLASRVSRVRNVMALPTLGHGRRTPPTRRRLRACTS